MTDTLKKGRTDNRRKLSSGNKFHTVHDGEEIRRRIRLVGPNAREKVRTRVSCKPTYPKDVSLVLILGVTIRSKSNIY